MQLLETTEKECPEKPSCKLNTAFTLTAVNLQINYMGLKKINTCICTLMNIAVIMSSNYFLYVIIVT